MMKPETYNVNKASYSARSRAQFLFEASAAAFESCHGTVGIPAPGIQVGF